MKKTKKILFSLIRLLQFLKIHSCLYYIYAKTLTWFLNRQKESDYPKYLKIWHYVYSGTKLNLDNPKTFNEKIQWLKLNERLPIKSLLVDKYKVKQWVTEKIGEEYVIPLLGVWEKPNDINFDELPEKFVIKINNGSNDLQVFIVKDKKALNIKKIKKQLKYWMDLNPTFIRGFKLHYNSIKPLIIAEEYIENENGSLNDYKFLCFNGEPKFCMVLVEDCLFMVDMDWEIQPFVINQHNKIDVLPEKPLNFEQMVSIARQLCVGFIQVRVDLYNIKGKIYFGELTFASGDGLFKFTPEEYDLILGDMIDMEKTKI